MNLNLPPKTRHEKESPSCEKIEAGGVFVMAGKKGMKHYPRELRLEAIRMFKEEGKTQKEIIEILGINDTRRVKKWLQ